MDITTTGDAHTRTFVLPGGHAEALLDTKSPGYIGACLGPRDEEFDRPRIIFVEGQCRDEQTSRR